jgi:RecB family exonuclease
MNPTAWDVDLARRWPPTGRPRGPFGPTTIEIIRSCPLRAAFSASRGYERRMGFAARVGLAMHRALETLVTDPIRSRDPSDVASQSRQRFDRALEQQLGEARERLREQRLVPDGDRVENAAEAVIGEALRLSRIEAAHPPQGGGGAHATLQVEVEVEVRSADGVLEGIVDRAERDVHGTHLVDYKSGTRADVPERYERQLQLYAYMWHETRDEWPASARVVYPGKGSAYSVNVDPDDCTRVADEARSVIASLLGSDVVTALPGEICRICEYRPWCVPFWDWASSGRATDALERGELGMEAVVSTVAFSPEVARIHADWHGTPISVDLPVDRFPHALSLAAGQRIRLLDVRVRGLRHQPTVFPTNLTELFLVNEASA